MAIPEPFSIWEGYRPVPHGYEQSYHMRQHPITRKWTIAMRFKGDDYFAIPEKSTGLEEVTKHLLILAKTLKITPGGVITINEFKQIIKPLYQGKGYNMLYIYLGIYPNLHLVFGDGSDELDNKNAKNLSTGDPWPYQKIGIRYRYNSRRDDFYMTYGDFFNEIQISLCDELGIDCKYLTSLVRAAKNGSGGAFYVNEHGLVYAPCYDPNVNTTEDAWSALYVGQINYKRWLTPDIVSRKLNVHNGIYNKSN